MGHQPSDRHTSNVPPGTEENATPLGAEEVRRESPSGRRRRLMGLMAATAIGAGAGAALGVQALLSGFSAPDRTATEEEPVQGLPILAVGSWAQIHPARTPEMCITEGRDRTHRYTTAVAAQYPCKNADEPHTYIEPLGDNLVQIQWHHPKYEIGCLTVLLDGPGRDLIEPREDCTEDNPAQTFRIEPIGPPAAAHFRIRPVATDQCLSLRDQDVDDGAEIVQGRCSGARDQKFLVALISPP
ncbi:RICIN domain-containing protein [Streptomyces sp. NPDC001508]|uniref:RICIN domain-containing protein n=1 Tax=Streptomyces sp. NPDC001508 TaxID=3154656 RepID=UPI0033186677